MVGLTSRLTLQPMASAYNDSNIFRQHGIPALKCGPSGGKVPPEAQGLLDEGERLSIRDLVSAARIYVALVLDMCSKTRSEIKQLGGELSVS